MKRLIEKLHSEACSCVIDNGTDLRTFHRKGIMDLFITLKNEPQLLNGASVAEKVVGKAAAALLRLGGVSRVYADVISTPAIDMLKEYGIAVEYGTETARIMNRDGTDTCPMELISGNETSPRAIRDSIETFLRGGGACGITDKTKS